MRYTTQVVYFWNFLLSVRCERILNVSNIFSAAHNLKSAKNVHVQLQWKSHTTCCISLTLLKFWKGTFRLRVNERERKEWQQSHSMRWIMLCTYRICYGCWNRAKKCTMHTFYYLILFFLPLFSLTHKSIHIACSREKNLNCFQRNSQLFSEFCVVWILCVCARMLDNIMECVQCLTYNRKKAEIGNGREECAKSETQRSSDRTANGLHCSRSHTMELNGWQKARCSKKAHTVSIRFLLFFYGRLSFYYIVQPVLLVFILSESWNQTKRLQLKLMREKL